MRGGLGQALGQLPTQAIDAVGRSRSGVRGRRTAGPGSSSLPCAAARIEMPRQLRSFRQAIGQIDDAALLDQRLAGVLALLFEEAGLGLLGFDVDPGKPDALHRGESYIRHIGT